MHVPGRLLTDSDILPFRDAYLEQERAEVSYDRSRWLYIPCRYEEYRYILGTRGEHPLICIGINPSTAAPDDLDNTLKSVERISLHNGYDSFIMFNVYAQRATDPDDMPAVRCEALHRENMEAFRHVLSSCGAGYSPAVWAAWGTIIEKRDYLVPTLRDMIDVGREYGAVWYTVGSRSRKGHPHHPLYLKKDALTEPFDIVSYTDGLTHS